MAEMDQQGLLFPGVDWPRPGERMRDRYVSLVASGRKVAPPSPLELAVERRRREGDIGPGEAPATAAEAALLAEADDLVAAIDDLEPEVLSRADEAWRTVVRLRHAAARLSFPGNSAVELRGAVKEAKDCWWPREGSNSAAQLPCLTRVHSSARPAGVYELYL